MSSGGWASVWRRNASAGHRRKDPSLPNKCTALVDQVPGACSTFLLDIMSTRGWSIMLRKAPTRAHSLYISSYRFVIVEAAEHRVCLKLNRCTTFQIKGPSLRQAPNIQAVLLRARGCKWILCERVDSLEIFPPLFWPNRPPGHTTIDLVAAVLITCWACTLKASHFFPFN